MSDIHDLSQETRSLATCPVIVYRGTEEVDTEIEEDYEECGCTLQVMATRTIVGDDYGSWPEIRVYFDCGHTLFQMEQALRYGEYM